MYAHSSPEAAFQGLPKRARNLLSIIRKESMYIPSSETQKSGGVLLLLLFYR